MADSIPGLEWYDGAASGQQRSAMMRMQPDRIMISHATACNQPWDNQYHARSDYVLFVDSGGYSHMIQGTGDYQSSDNSYLRYLETVAPSYWALRDYPCEPDLLASHDTSVAEHQARTIDHHVRLLDAAEDRSIPGQPVAVLQGWTVEDYLHCYDALREQGALTDYLGIGSLCRRHQPERVARIIVRLRDALPSRYDLHAFGVKNEILQYVEVVDALRSADSGAYSYSFSRHEREPNESFTFRDAARGWLTWRRRLRKLAGTRSLNGTSPAATETIAPTDSDPTIRDQVWTAVLDILRSNATPVSTQQVCQKAGIAETTTSRVKDTLDTIATTGWLTAVQQDEETLWQAGPTAIAEFET